MNNKLSIFASAIEKDNKRVIKIYCGVEQLVARWAHNPKVVRSSRAPATISRKSSNFRLYFENIVYAIKDTLRGGAVGSSLGS